MPFSVYHSLFTFLIHLQNTNECLKTNYHQLNLKMCIFVFIEFERKCMHFCLTVYASSWSFIFYISHNSTKCRSMKRVIFKSEYIIKWMRYIIIYLFAVWPMLLAALNYRALYALSKTINIHTTAEERKKRKK